MQHATLYEEDVHAWALEQARILRELATRGIALPNDLDVEHVAEEIEDLGNEVRFQAESNLEQALIHVIRIVADPQSDARRHWLKEIDGFLDIARRRYRPSMRQLMDVQDLWAAAVRRVSREREIDGEPMPRVPDEAPFSLADLLSDDADPGALAARLAKMVATLPPG